MGKHGNGWAYGLVQENKELKLMEIMSHADSGEYTPLVAVEWKDIKSQKTINMILEDIKTQLLLIVKDKQKHLKFKIKGEPQ